MKNDDLERILNHSVAEIVFIKADGSQRSMLCTRSRLLLETPEAQQYLKWRAPSGPPPYNPKRYNNLIVWDIQREDYRQINCNTVLIVRQVSAEQYLNALKTNPEVGLQ